MILALTPKTHSICLATIEICVFRALTSVGALFVFGGIFMKIAVVGSRGITDIDLSPYLADCDEIISGGARGVDACAAAYAREHGIKITEILPEYARYGRAAPIVRNQQIVDYADHILIFWDGKSRGTASVIQYAQKIKKPYQIILSQHQP